MRSFVPLFITLLTAATVLFAQSNGPANVPPIDEFLRMVDGTITVIGDRVYYQGGILSQKGFIVPERKYGNPLNSTLSIDLSKSWTPEDVVIDEAPRPSNRPSVVQQVIWTDEKEGAFYTWGGVSVHGTPNAPDEIQKFTPGSGGSGTWSDITVASGDASLYYDTWQRVSAISINTPDTAFVFGGDGVSDNDTYYYNTFDFATREWKVVLEPDPAYATIATAFSSRAVFAPIFGPNGLIFILGGSSGRDQYVSYDTIQFFDPAERRWFSQNTTGFPPAPARSHCVVGVAGENGTYDIFVYGGIHSWDTSIIDVLSLPGFRWTRLYGHPDERGRFDHECAVVGNCQMLSWGGMQQTKDAGDPWLNSFNEPDSLPHGLAIFDMVEGEWKDSYDPDAPAYRANPSIAAFHTQEEYAKIEWTSRDVMKYFLPDSVDSKFPSPDGGSGSEGTDSDGEGARGNGQGEDNGPNNSPKSTPIGPIVGGVLGGVFIIVLVPVAFCVCRRRKRSRQSASKGDEQIRPGEEKKSTVTELDGKQSNRLELDGNALWEME